MATSAQQDPPVKRVSRAVHCLLRLVGEDSAAGPIVRGLNDNIRKRPEVIWLTQHPELLRRNVTGQVFHEDHVVRIVHAPWRMGRDAGCATISMLHLLPLAGSASLRIVAGARRTPIRHPFRAAIPEALHPRGGGEDAMEKR